MREESKFPPLVCENCGSEDIQSQAWVGVNNNQVYEFFGLDDEDNNWCMNCQEQCDIIDQSTYIDRITEEGDESTKK